MTKLNSCFMDAGANKSTILRKVIIGLMLGSVCLTAGCSKKDKDVDLTSYVDKIDPPDVLYNQALANLDAGRLSEAAKKFEAVDRQHPYTEWARKSLVMGAFTNYRKGN